MSVMPCFCKSDKKRGYSFATAVLANNERQRSVKGDGLGIAGIKGPDASDLELLDPGHDSLYSMHDALDESMEYIQSMKSFRIILHFKNPFYSIYFLFKFYNIFSI